MEKQKVKISYLKYFFALLLFGTNGIVASFIDLNSYEIVLFRTLIGSALLVFLFLLGRNKFTFYKNKKHFSFLFISGIAMGLSWMLLYEAYARIGVSISSLLYYCGPVIVMMLSPFLFKERPTTLKVVGFIVVFVGIFFVNGNVLNGSADAFGILCGVLSAVMYSFMVIFNKKAHDITGLENATLQLVISFLTVAAFVGFKQRFIIDISASDILPLIILGIVNTGVGCYFYFTSIGKLPVQTVAICGYIEPLSAVLFSAVLLGETMLPIQIAGAVLIVSGAIISECIKRR